MKKPIKTALGVAAGLAGAGLAYAGAHHYFKNIHPLAQLLKGKRPVGMGMKKRRRKRKRK